MNQPTPPRHGILRQLGHRGCVRVPLQFDVSALRQELEALDPSAWGRAGRDPLVLASVHSFFAIGHPRRRGAQASDDPGLLDSLPVLRRLLTEQLPGYPSRAIVARHLSEKLIPLHRDTPRYFRGSVRLSIQVDADGPQAFYCEELRYDFAVGEVWAIDNLQRHGIFNAGRRPRTTVIVDLAPSPQLEALLAAGNGGLGRQDPEGYSKLRRLTRQQCGGPVQRWQRLRWELKKLLNH